MTYNALLKKGENIIKKHNLEPNVAKIFLMKYSGLSHSKIILHLDDKVDVSIIDKFLWAIDEYTLKKRPSQYIINEQDFYGRTFYVNEDVFIPRWETEELVERVIYYIDDYFEGKNIKILDIGTGSGCIPITLAKETENTEIIAIDISEKALKIAQKNSENLNADVKFILSNLFTNVVDKFDIIVSNPPYIKTKGFIGETVDKEPALALYGGAEGLDIYEKIFKEAHEHLNERFLIALEHGFDQKDAIKTLALKYFKNVVITQFEDSSGTDRMTFIERT